jgi:hypothetical protein
MSSSCDFYKRLMRLVIEWMLRFRGEPILLLSENSVLHELVERLVKGRRDRYEHLLTRLCLE